MEINSNIGCIETVKLYNYNIRFLINSNIGCIETQRPEDL
ncbi:MAG: hypothetical protein RHS_4480 [Robinsoniella sp. RHS]|nr:MAG: hypothetical protein RHS_5251 [Robinsoniella sp. RHS]KLU69713.1 MAG: hypothetical protein RHS_4480 [Robinsoniella sp. RHS]